MDDDVLRLMQKAEANKKEAQRELENVTKAKKLAEIKQRQEEDRRKMLAEEAKRKVRSPICRMPQRPQKRARGMFSAMLTITEHNL
jgi:hypothetical protein